MLRLHFTATDVLTTRFATEPIPLMELGLALATLQRRDPLFAGWRSVHRRQFPNRARPLLELIPRSGAGPLFLDPISADLAPALELVQQTPTPLLRRELRRVFGPGQGVSLWVRELDRRDADAWSLLATAMTAAYDALLAGDWHRLRVGFDADVSLRGQQLARYGVRTTLAALCVGSSWDGDVMQIPSRYPRDLFLSGRGLTLLPSLFWRADPLFCDHPDGSLLLLYPSATPLPLVRGAGDGDRLADLLGATRAEVLRLSHEQLTTSELARSAGISIASASQHAKVLRLAGLVSSHRTGKAVVHEPTPLGVGLSAANSA
jgi:DNA-binding transcriptional ArsR family regulator